MGQIADPQLFSIIIIAVVFRKYKRNTLRLADRLDRQGSGKVYLGFFLYTGNLTPVKSDIEDWTPDNSGAKKLVDVNTYGDLPYPWPEADATKIPQRIESQWYIYWMQNMPGHGNQIRYGQKQITNWWIFTADWDAAISSSVGLFE